MPVLASYFTKENKNFAAETQCFTLCQDSLKNFTLDALHPLMLICANTLKMYFDAVTVSWHRSSVYWHGSTVYWRGSTVYWRGSIVYWCGSTEL